MRGAVIALGALSATYAAFSALLYAGGVPARAVWLPIDPARYYLAQAFFIAPLMVSLAVIFTLVVRALAGGGTVRFRDAFAVFAPVYAWPLLVLFVLPDLAVYLAFGHGALAKAMRLYAPLVPIAITALGAARARRAFGCSLARGALASFGALAAQGAFGAVLLR
jgi:hypothetical protein